MRRLQRSSAWMAVALLVAVSACFAAIEPAVWLDVPFVKQEANGCGAACISMVMQYWLKQGGGTVPSSAEARQIQRTLYNPKAKGIYADEMEQYFRENGYRVFAFSATWKDLEHHLSEGRPLIVCLASGRRHGPLHYVVVAGLDQQQGVVLVNDPAQRKLLKMDDANFESRWKAMHNWTLLALPGQRK